MHRLAPSESTGWDNVAMGQLVPEDFDFSLLKNDSEREVVRAIRDQLSDHWRVIPNFLFNHEHRDHENQFS